MLGQVFHSEDFLNFSIPLGDEEKEEEEEEEKEQMELSWTEEEKVRGRTKSFNLPRRHCQTSSKVQTFI